MFVLMAFGPFQFSLATFAYEEAKRRAQARIERVKIIGGRPSLHMAGLDDETLTLKSTFHPRHLSGNGGLPQVAGLRAALGQSYPLLGNRLSAGDMLGRWALEAVEDTQTEIFVDGFGQAVSVDMELVYDGRTRSPGAALALIGLLG
ncbi:phage tail protein [Methylobacterium hispanicum]|uniref:phage tail protein n=1 Tax=Methylobacterium hispanicum TaxID=270350 RepID=UPI002F2C61C8